MKRNNSRLWLGIILVIFGAALVLRNLGIFYFEIFSWPMILIIIGLVIIINSKQSFAGYFLVILGGFWLASRYYHFSLSELIHDYWPLLFILLGIYILFKRDSAKSIKEKKNNEDNSSDFIDESSIFNDVKTYAVSQNFKGGKLTTLFGANKLDVTGAKLAQGNQILDVLVIFGGIDMRVPADWDINIKVTSIFGGFEDKRRIDPNFIPQQDSTLEIKGLVIFGGGEITG